MENHTMKVTTTNKKKKEKSEKLIQIEIMRFLEKIGCSADIISNTGYGKRGIADIIGCMADGKYIAIEVKRANGKVTELQDMWLKIKKSRGGIIMVAKSVEDVKERLALYGYNFHRV